MRDVIAFLRARLDEMEAEASALHFSACPAAQTAAGLCRCGYPQQLLEDVAARRELIDELVHWLESELSSDRERSRTHRALLLMAQPWVARADFDPYWRVVDA